jgi:hypothetical protein
VRAFIICTLHPPGITMLKTRRIRWSRHVRHMTEKKMPTKFWSEDEIVRLEDLGLNGKIVFKWTLNKYQM